MDKAVGYCCCLIVKSCPTLRDPMDQRGFVIFNDKLGTSKWSGWLQLTFAFWIANVHLWLTLLLLSGPVVCLYTSNYNL